MARSRWRWFAAWAAAGGLLVFSILAGLSIGIFVLPFALVAVWLVQRFAGWGPEVVGGIAGAGVVALVVAFLSRDYRPCPDGPLTVPPGATSVECGGFSPTPWWIAGLALVVGAILAYALLRPRVGAPRRARGPLTGGDKLALAVVAALAAVVLLLAATTGWSGDDDSGEFPSETVP